MTLLQSGVTKSGAAYTIDQSVRFDDGDSAYLSRTPSSGGNRRIFTLSCWVKRGSIGSASNRIYGNRLNADNTSWMYFTGADELQFYSSDVANSEGTISVITEALFRDPSAWYHVVFGVDITDSGTEVKIYVNGVEQAITRTVSSFSTNHLTRINHTVEQDLGRQGPVDPTDYFDGYLAEVYFIDGTRYAASDFGETDSATNQWKPVDASGLTFGTNGFYQKYGSHGGHTSFTTVESTTWTAPEGVTSVDYLVVAGGGGGGGDRSSGGGGAGGFRTGTLTVVGGTSYTVTVGAGGAGGASSNGVSGSDSVFSTVTSTGGGYGTTSSADAGSGGSGGGGGNDATNDNGGSGNTPVTSPSQGSDGGYGNDAPGSVEAGGGGGGAGAVGGNASGTTSGNGGAGTANSITGSSVTYAGGGGGSSHGGTDGSGGSGGGGAAGSNGTANTGGGGGAALSSPGGDGGSGIVIIKVVAGQGFGLDSSGEGNNFTQTNLVASDKMGDTPSNNFATLNPLSKILSPTYSEGNLKGAVEGDYEFRGTFPMFPETKWYWECYIMANPHEDYTMLGIADPTDTLVCYNSGNAGIAYYGSNGNIYQQASGASYGAAYTAGDIMGVALNLVDDELTYYKNGVSQGAVTGVLTTPFCYVPAMTGAAPAAGMFNFGQDSSFGGNTTAQGNADENGIGDFYYAVPAGFLAPCASNIADPSIKLPGDNFNTVLYTGDGATTLAVTGAGFQPDLTWIKNRDATDKHVLVDSVRGANNYFTPNTTAASVDDSTFVASLDSDGFTVGNDVAVNTNTENYASWNWLAADTFDPKTDGDIAVASGRRNVTAGFSIVRYTGENATNTIGHGLATAPKLIFVKNLGVLQWPTFYLRAGDNDGVVFLDQDGPGSSADVSYWNGTIPSATVFTVGNSGNTGGLTSPDYLAYCFADVEGYSKIGLYEGNNNADGTFVYTGFRPAFLLLKNVETDVRDWMLEDDKRLGYNVDNNDLIPNQNYVEATDDRLDMLSNGFKLRGTQTTSNAANTYLYYAIAKSPFKYANAR